MRTAASRLAAVALLGGAFAAPGARAEAPAAPLELTLEKAISMGLAGNLNISLANEQLVFLESQRRQAIGAALPAVTISGLYNRNLIKPKFFLGGTAITAGQDNSTRHVASVQQYLFAGGAVSEGIRMARVQVEGGRAQVQAAKEDVVLAVKQLFYAVCLASATAAIQEDALAQAEDHLKTIQERYRQGLDSDLSELRQEVEVANAKPALLGARNGEELSLTLLKDSLGLDVDVPVRLVGGLESARRGLVPYEVFQSAALRRNPTYQAALRQLEAADSFVSVMSAVRWPFLSFYADAQWYSESDSLRPGPNERAWSSVAGLRLSYPLFTGGQTSAKIDQALSQRDQARTAVEQTERAIHVEVKRQWLAVREAFERAQSQEAAISQARRALEATEVRYKAGEASLLEQNDVTLALSQTRLLYANALHDYRAALAALERATGVPEEEIAR